MPDPTVGRIVSLECHQPPPMCVRCAKLEKAIKDYIDGFTARNASQEGKALIKLAGLVDE